MGTFSARIDELLGWVGEGTISLHVKVEQFYAIYVHEILRYHHPVGQAKFLEVPLHANSGRYLRTVADRLLSPHGLQDSMIESSEQLAGDSAAITPVEFGNLHRSQNPRVIDNGSEIYNRAADAPPISRAAHNAMRRGRRRR